jgi:Flp pilus assembly pilin Flp
MDIKRRLRDDRGVTSVEYGLIAVAVAVAVAVIVFTLGADVVKLFNGLESQL